MAIEFKLSWRTNLDLTLYNQTILSENFDEYFQLMTSGPFVGQYNVAEKRILSILPRGFLLTYPQLVSMLIVDGLSQVGFGHPNIFRPYCCYGPAYILTAIRV